jgi:hypothetical protein
MRRAVLLIICLADGGGIGVVGAQNENLAAAAGAV